jgi:four helix bundle protein
VKSQTPTANIQRSSKRQAPKAGGGLQAGGYPEISPLVSALNDGPNNNHRARHAFDLEERTAVFGEAIVRFSKKIPRDATNNRLTDQVVGCGTSIGANYREANESVSKKDFRFSISRCVKEAKETKFFLRMVAASEAQLVDEARVLYREGNELHMIFAKIFRKLRE